MKSTKSTKSSRISLPHRGRSNRSAGGHEKAPSPSRAARPKEPVEEMKEEHTAQGVASPPPAQTSRPSPSQVSNPFAQETGDLEEMRRRMSEALAQKHQMLAASSIAEKMEDPRDPTNQPESSSDESINTINTGTMSTDSARTLRAYYDATPGTIRTPSYPFPRMQLRLNRGYSQRSGPSHKPFTLLSPTNEPVPDPSRRASAESAESDMSTPLGRPSKQDPTIPEDPNFPTPDLYDMVLMLSSEPGLEMWWANVTEILAEAYGAERASLAIPGDMTDLENVPWGQKATFHLYGSDFGGVSNLDSITSTSEPDTTTPTSRPELSSSLTGISQVSAQRPPLLSRHSIAGPLPENASSNPLQRPAGPVRAASSITMSQDERLSPTLGPRLTFQSPTPRTSSVMEPVHQTFQPPEDPSLVAFPSLHCRVHKALQPLEGEPDALLVRTGVAALFGKRRPVILTRAYSEEGGNASATSTSLSDESRERSKQKSMDRSSFSSPTSRLNRPLRAFEEFEQPEPSPWSQSPSPSPAARPDPEESPFFAQPATLDETAFEQNPPVYDYAATANQSLSAIGADMSKTLVHIPLIQPLPTRGAVTSSLRFPIAILSFLTSVTPFPRNLRHSLTTLLPHLASTYSLAKQYSTVLERFKGGSSSRHGAAFGLGGTFSDEGSELELVAELSGQIAQDQSKSKQSSHQGSVYSPTDRALPFRESPAGSAASTPFLDHLGFRPGVPPSPGKSAAEMVDSYFMAKRIKSSHQPTTPGHRSVPDDKNNSNDKGRSTSKTATRRSGNKSTPDVTTPLSARAGSTTSESDNGEHPIGLFDRIESSARRQSTNREFTAREEGEKALPELISSLMLNAIPLQLFLAKPGSGDLVWTNRKFDAFRSQGDGRVRDPWKNVHPLDRSGLVKLWNEALRSGGQFTHYIRVKRFNSDSDYKWFVFRASTLLSNTGTLLYWIGSFLDVHDQYMKNLEASEREATMARDAKIRALADAIPQVMFEALEGEGIVAVNQQWDTFSGQNLEEARGLGFAKHVHRDDLHKCGLLSPPDVPPVARTPPGTELTSSSSSSSSSKTVAVLTAPAQKNLFAPDAPSLERMIQQGSVTVEKDENGRLSYLTEIRLRSRGGEYRWFLVRLVRVESALLTSNHASWYGTCTDIEVRKILERELNSANQKVHLEMESKTKFFANMSHEIRTPLNGILGSMPWLVESSLDLDQRRTVDTIQNSANNLRELVDNILDVTKVEAGKMTLVPKWFHVRSLCEEVVDTVSSRAIERGLELNYSLDSNVPSMVKGDPFRVRQVLLNLMGNSVKFTEQGEVYMRCSVREETTSETGRADCLFLAFDVVDTGRGFNESDFQRLFKQFGQLGGGSNHDAGSGLGLFLSKQLVEMHGGELSVKSQAGEGSTFSFYIKVEMAPPGAELNTLTVESRPNHLRHSTSMSSSRSRSDTKTPTISNPKLPGKTQGVIHTPGLSRYVTSPESSSTSPPVISPPIVSSEGSGQSMRSNSGNIILSSSISSQIPTPESVIARDTAVVSERQQLAEKAMASLPEPTKSQGDVEGNVLTPEMAHPAMYSIVVICPAEHARSAIKQHIEHVVPHQMAVNVTTIADIGSFLDLMNGPATPTFTHIVLDLPASSDVMLFMRQLTTFTATIVPTLVVITDYYQKRDIVEDFSALTASGRKAYMIHKPVKPSVFAMIFDPSQLRNLSKDRQREVAQTNSEDFRNLANQVKDKIGGKNHRLLLVEDSDVNRMVIVRYLTKVALDNESARDGQECTDKVFEHPYGYYSLIICDIQMPRKNGYQACREIRQWEAENGYPPVPIMALTANAMPEERAAAAAAGFTDYLTKPVEFNLLGTMMMTLLDPTLPHIYLRDRPLEL